jgi:hypothetical protein
MIAMEGIRKSKDNLCHIDRLGLARRTEDVCAVCGKTFYRTVDHVYMMYVQKREKYMCSWTCYRAAKRQEEARQEEDQARKDEAREEAQAKKKQDARDKREKPKPQMTKAQKKKAAMERIALCERKIAEWSEISAMTKPSTRERKAARQNMREWMARKERAKETLEELGRKGKER